MTWMIVLRKLWLICGENSSARSRLEAMLRDRLETVKSDAAQARLEIQKHFANSTEEAFNVLDAKLDQAMYDQKFANDEARGALRRDCKRDIEELQLAMLQLSRGVSTA